MHVMWSFKIIWHKNIFWHGNMFRPLKANTSYKEYVQDEPIFVLSIISANLCTKRQERYNTIVKRLSIGAKMMY